MSLFSEKSELDKNERANAIGGRTKMPETPDLTKWGADIRKSSPFLLDDFSGSSVSNITKP